MERYHKACREVVRVAQAMYEQGLVVGTWGNVSACLPGREEVVITPSGMDYTRLSPEDMVIIDLEGRKTHGKWKPSVEVPLHLAIYRARPDIWGVVHVHSIAASAFAVARMAIPPALEETAQLIGGEVEVAEYQPPGTRRLARAAVEALGQKNAVLLANHGLVGVGADVDRALKACLVAEKTAQVTIYARMLGQVNFLSPEEVRVLAEGFKHYGQVKENESGRE
ncbi:MAG TPA: class II aldolase/adducin family protein [Syntrophothermus lipocalidus]|nr:class II aldolase/adducin family protein [Syntrophothermus lipocalidus]